MPSDEIRSFPVTEIKNNGSDEVDNRQWKPGDDRNQGHQITVRSFFGFMVTWHISNRGSSHHKPLHIFQIQLMMTSPMAGMAIHFDFR